MDYALHQTQEKLQLLETATLIIKNQHSSMYKDEIQENLLEAKNSLHLMSKGIMSLKTNLQQQREEINRCKEMLSLVEILNDKLKHMEENIPIGIKEYVKLQGNDFSTGYTNSEGKENMSIASNTEVFTLSSQSSIKDCKKSLFKELEVCPLVSPLTQQEFVKIPKYIIGRQSLDSINSLIVSINQILKEKYTVLSLGKNGARKKGDLDLYLEYKKQQTSVEEGEGKIYFFTAEDYLKHTSSKLDKIKLNMLTALRSCKKLREIRIGKSLFYMIVVSN